MALRIARSRLLSLGDLPGSNGGIYNPGAVLAGSTILLLCRREIDYRFTNSVFPELIAVDADTLKVTDHRTLLKVGYPPNARIEDFRCIDFDGMLLVAHTLVQPERIKPVISQVVDDSLRLFDSFDLPVEPRRVEKNWVLFEHGGALHCLYKLDPLTIFVLDANRSWRAVKEEENGWADQLEQTLSNSANLIPFEGGYLGFWHSILNGRYVQGAYHLGHDLALKYRTGILMDGTDVREGYKPGVLYVSSLVEHDRRVLAFYGEADAHTGVAVLDRDELWEELRRSPFRAAQPIRVRYEGSTMSDAFRAMCALQEFSARRGHPRIRLYVPDARIRPTIHMLKTRNIIVQPATGKHEYHCTVIGGSGRLVWEPDGREPGE